MPWKRSVPAYIAAHPGQAAVRILVGLIVALIALAGRVLLAAHG